MYIFANLMLNEVLRNKNFSFNEKARIELKFWMIAHNYQKFGLKNESEIVFFLLKMNE